MTTPRDPNELPVPRAADTDPEETGEWLEALEEILERRGPAEAQALLAALVRRAGVSIPAGLVTPYVNSIPPHEQSPYPGNLRLERRIESLVRWNAMAMVVQANRQREGLGGHISTFASAATLYLVGLNHFFRAPSENGLGDLVVVQAQSAPGLYARAFLEGRLSRESLERYRRTLGPEGLPAYPDARAMPEFWHFATASLGLGPLIGVHQARFMRYLHDRGILDTSGRRVWCFVGDGEMDQPESLGGLGLAARERLDNLIFVVNCNLQRIDGPVRGNGKIIQELETIFRGAGWNVIKVIWGSDWDELLERDESGLLVQRMNEVVDGQYQRYSAESGSYIRRDFFGKYPELAKLVEHMSDEDLERLGRGGHDPVKVYAAYRAAVKHTGAPTVILAKTIKGYGLGEAGEGRNVTHQQKKLNEEELRQFRDRFEIPIPDHDLAEAPFYRPSEGSVEVRYLEERRADLGGYVPARKVTAEPLALPDGDFYGDFFGGIDRPVATTMALVQLLSKLLKNGEIGPRIVPIVADGARTFGLESLFRHCGIYSSVGQVYEPVDAKMLLYYKEARDGQILEEGVNSAGALASWLAAATSFACHQVPMIPVYFFYSMFGFQRLGDLIWAAAAMRTRGFLVGAVAGRTSLAGEGIQHQDGQSPLWASAVPSCVAYDPAFAYELAVIVEDGLRRMVAEGEDVFYYLTTYNENYEMPAMPEESREGILRGIHRLRSVGDADAPRVRLLGSGAILIEVLAAADLLVQRFGIASEVWSVTSFSELRRDGLRAERHNRLHPEAPPAVPYVTSRLVARGGPVVAVSDYMRTVADQIRAFVPAPFVALGTDGYGRSDTREDLRRHFEVDRSQIALAAVKALADEGVVTPTEVAEVIRQLGIDPDAADPAGA